jgi:hypothetical protein
LQSTISDKISAGVWEQELGLFFYFFTFVDIRKDGTNWSRRAVEVLKKHKRAMAIAVLELNCHGYICSEHQEATVFHSCRAHNM